MMLPQNKPLKSSNKLTILFLLIALLIGIALFWLFSDKDGASVPAMTEHDFKNGHAVWTINPYAAKVLHENTFTFQVTDITGAPLQGAAISVQLDMIGMVCGNYNFDMKESSPGVYKGEGVPLMAGTWKATLTINKDKETYTVIRRLMAVH